MKRTAVKIIAGAVCVVLIAMMVACGTPKSLITIDPSISLTNAPQAGTADTATAYTSALNTQTTLPVSEIISTVPGQTTDLAPTTAAQQGQTNPMSMTKEQLLNWFNAAVNELKTEKLGFTKEKQTKTADIVLSNSAANSLVSIVKDSLLSEDLQTSTVAKGQDSTATVSPDGKSFVSQLALSDTEAVEIVQSGANYVVTVKIPAAVNPADASAYGKIFTYITVDDVEKIHAPKVGATVARENISVSFSGCYAKATIDASGKLIDYTTYVAGVMTMKDASIKKVITINSDLTVTLMSTTVYKNIMR